MPIENTESRSTGLIEVRPLEHSRGCSEDSSRKIRQTIENEMQRLFKDVQLGQELEARVYLGVNSLNYLKVVDDPSTALMAVVIRVQAFNKWTNVVDVSMRDFQLEELLGDTNDHKIMERTCLPNDAIPQLPIARKKKCPPQWHFDRAMSKFIVKREELNI